MNDKLHFIIFFICYIGVILGAGIKLIREHNTPKSYDIGGERIVTCSRLVRHNPGYIDLLDCEGGKDYLNLEGQVIALK